MNKAVQLRLAVLTVFFMAACSNETPIDKEDAKTEIAAAEREFEKMAAEKGIAEAFWAFADSSAVIKRQNDSLIRGRDNIRNYYSSDFYKTATVKWAPDFIDVSEKGDMGYTYGKYLWQSRDSSGKLNEYRGVFHTVWKKQADGSWKYVWD
ncbi:MAG TPA: nuclear transport factor 2 family protein [Chitinophagaceae bacterium]|nr:nuclear transport factor 2 family protein [Chitinophagaceae bacterium]